MFSFKRVYAVAKREYLELRRNTLYVIMAFFCPVIIFLPFAYGLNLDTEDVKLGICDMDNSPLSRDFTNVFLTTGGYFTLVEHTLEYDTMDKKIKSGDLEVVLVIPHDFSKKLNDGKKVEVQFMVDAIYASRAETVGGYLESAVSEFNQKLQTDYLDFKGIKNFESPITIYQKVWFNDTLESDNFIIPPIIPVLLYFLPPLISSLTIVKERK